MRTIKKQLPCLIKGNEFEYIKLVDENGVYHNEIRLKEAIEMAKEKNLDLVCFNDVTAKALAFCKMIDFGKWKYSQEKKKKKQNKENKKTKEIRIGVDISDNDLDHKVKRAKDFLTRGDDVIFSMLLKGRQRYRLKNAIEKMDSVRDICSEFGGESSRKNVAPNMTLRLSPLSRKKQENNNGAEKGEGK